MADHIAQTRVYRHGQLFETGEVVDYDGEPAWQFEPVDQKARAAWLKSVADPAKVREENWKLVGRYGDPGRFEPAYAAECAAAQRKPAKVAS